MIVQIKTKLQREAASQEGRTDISSPYLRFIHICCGISWSNWYGFFQFFTGFFQTLLVLKKLQKTRFIHTWNKKGYHANSNKS